MLQMTARYACAQFRIGLHMLTDTRTYTPECVPGGLTSAEASKRLLHYGKNLLPEPSHPGVLVIFLYQFKSPFIYVLLVAAIISLGLNQAINAFFIFAVLLLNAAIGTVQEYAAERAAAALKKMVPSQAVVIRDGRPQRIDTSQVVPGDLVQLVPGDKIPADLRLCVSHDLQADESLLTGESVPSIKDATIDAAARPALSDRSNICFAGSVIMRGRGSGEVIATGSQTEIGKIAADIGSEFEIKPPLMQRIERFTLRITYSILILITLIFIITVLRGDDIASVFLLGIALAVSAIPEGLPAAITVALAIGMRRMAKRNVIIRRLLAVETLGSCTYIATDKTGTLTVNEMTVRQLVFANGERFSISGEGMDLHGQITPVPSGHAAERLRLLCSAGALANESLLQHDTEGWHGTGDMVDVAFLVLAEKAGININELRARNPELGRIPYESSLGYSASINRFEDHIELFIKGSVEKLLAMTAQNTVAEKQRHADITQHAEQLARDGYRVLGIAHRRLPAMPDMPDNALHDIEFLGISGMLDPLRPEAIEAVKDCRAAQIDVGMITGDHPQTALALARELGIADKAMQAVTGSQLADAQNNVAEFQRLVHSTRVFARIEPHQKKRIVEQLIDDGEFVAVTGDGVNDAPALSHAHVGIAMGLRGTDVARESADLILTDDHFASIVHGIRHGRIVYNNVRKVIFLLISTGAAEIMLVLLSILMGTPLPLLPIQLLWLNLVTNGIQDIALAFEPAEGHELQKPPRHPNEPIFDRLMIERVVVNALVMGCLAFAVFKWQLNSGASVESARNITLLLMVLFENVHVLNSRSETVSIFRMNFFSNPLLLYGMLGAQAVHIAAMFLPGLGAILQIVPVTFDQWLLLLLVALSLIAVDESHKFYRK